ncbi:MAG TPA: zinc ribbon domain-containing protein [Coleofasciculaceae cyanobacterium]|jgi:putative FmdB family regulatory protein
MPSYNYRCLHCGHTESVVQSFQDTLAPACTTCGGLTERIIEQAPTVLKSTPDPTPTEPETHECHSACVMHRRSSLNTLPAD